MKPIYKKILKELKKGSAVLLDVKPDSIFKSRIRLVTPNECVYMALASCDGSFDRSCFLLQGTDLTPLLIVNEMIAFDGFIKVKSIKMQVLK